MGLRWLAGAKFFWLLLFIGGFSMIAVHSWRLLEGCCSFLTSFTPEDKDCASSTPKYKDCVWG